LIVTCHTNTQTNFKLESRLLPMKEWVDHVSFCGYDSISRVQAPVDERRGEENKLKNEKRGKLAGLRRIFNRVCAPSLLLHTVLSSFIWIGKLVAVVFYSSPLNSICFY